MQHSLSILDAARVQLRALSKDDRRNIGYRLELLRDDLQGDVKKLKGAKNLYRLRVGSFRTMFLLEDAVITVYAVVDRKDAYL